MAKQLHRSFRDQQVRSLLQSYVNEEIELPYILDILKIGRSRFFVLLNPLPILWTVEGLPEGGSKACLS